MSVPSLHSPTLPCDGPHEPSGPMSSSKLPSQSLSLPSHCSGCGPTEPMHCTLPPTQCMTPDTHSPMSVPHTAPPPGSPLSTMPSQLSSLLLQVSGCGVLPLHTSLPPVHDSVPAVHSPTFDEHASPTWGSGSAAVFSSTMPSQSLSWPSQISTPEGTHASGPM